MKNYTPLTKSAASGLMLAAVLGLPGLASGQFVAFNDHVPGTIGTQTHANTTTWNVANAAPGATGLLKDITSGVNTPVTVTITLTGTPTYGGTAGVPNAGSPLATTFDGFVYFGSGTQSAVQVPTGVIVTYTFTGLDVGKHYSFRGGVVRGGSGSNYGNRFTKVAIVGAVNFTSAHSAGMITTADAPADLAANEAAFNAGINLEGVMVGWDDIIPDAAGSFQVTSTRYTGFVPGGGSSTANTPPYGYAISGFRLEEINAVQTMLAITGDPANTTVNEGQTATFTATVTGSGGTYRWYKQGNPNPIAGATGPTLTIPNALSANIGTYFLTVSNSVNQVESAHRTLSVIPDLAAPTMIRAILSNDLTTVLLSFSEPVDAPGGPGSGALDSINYNMYIDSPGDGPGIQSVDFQTGSNQTNIVVTLFGAATAGINYKLQVENVTDRAENHNLINPSPSVINISSFAPIMTFAGQTWRFHEPGVAAPVDWFTTGFDDSTWSNGLSVLDYSLTAPNRTTLPNSMEAVNYFLPMTNALEGAGGFSVTNRIPTYYFRTHFSFPGDPSLHPAATFLHMRTTVDDAVVIYLNGALAFRGPGNLAPPANDPFPSYGNGTGVGNGNVEGPFLLPATNLHSGDNVIAVLLKQGSPTSSDITMGLELEGIIPVVVQPLSLTITRDGSGGLVVSWTDSTATLQQTTDVTPPRTWGAPNVGALTATSLTLTPAQANGAPKKFWRLIK
jgi:hypothetical protein